MPVQTQMSSMAKKFGGQVAAANAEYKDKPVDTGNMQLPAGIKNGIFKLKSIGWFKEEEKDRKTPVGEDKCEAVGIVVYPESHNGQKCENLRTTQTIPLCDLPKAPYQKEAVTFKHNLAKFINLLKQLSNGTMVCQETPQTDPTGQKTLAYWEACMKTLSDPKRSYYIRFSTRGWTPPKPIGWKEGDPVPEERVIHNWHEFVSPEEVEKLKGQFNPASGVTVAGRTDQSAVAFEEPPQGVVDPKSIPSSNGTGHEEETPSFDSLEEEVNYLIENANDADSSVCEQSRERLRELAIANGWTEDQVDDQTKGWEDVGNMALNPPDEQTEGTPTVGSKWKYTPRDSKGNKLKNGKGEELKSLEVEVSSVDSDNNTCTVHNCKDNRVVVDVKTRKPAIVKFEWLDPV